MKAAITGFAGFRPAAFAFLNELRDNNDPAWFKPRKALYEAEVLGPFGDLITAVGATLRKTAAPLVGDPRRGIFRIYRDVRFSPDKRLYKAHAGAVLTRSGGWRDPGVLYIHVAPGQSMAAAGFWHPEPALLTRLRRAGLGDPDGVLAVAGRGAPARCPLSRGDGLPALQRRPAEPPAPWLRSGQGHAGSRLCRLEVLYCASPAERRRNAVASTGRPHRRFRPRGAAVARMGLGGGRGRDAGAAADPQTHPAVAQAGLLAVVWKKRRVSLRGAHRATKQSGVARACRCEGQERSRIAGSGRNDHTGPRTGQGGRNGDGLLRNQPQTDGPADFRRGDGTTRPHRPDLRRGDRRRTDARECRQRQDHGDHPRDGNRFRPRNPAGHSRQRQGPDGVHPWVRQCVRDAISRAAFNREWFASSPVAGADMTVLAFSWPSEVHSSRFRRTSSLALIGPTRRAPAA